MNARGMAGVVLFASSAVLAQDLQPFQAEEVQPVRAEQVQPTRAADVQPVTADGVRPARAADVQPSGATGVERRDASEPEWFVAEDAKLAPKPGVDPVPNPRPFDRSVAGTWTLFIPGGSYSTRTHEGPYVVDTVRTGTGTEMGALELDRSGRYRWHKSGKVIARGSLVEVRPRQGADANARYWLLERDGERFYFAVWKGTLSLFAAEGNSFVANGRR